MIITPSQEGEILRMASEMKIRQLEEQLLERELAKLKLGRLTAFVHSVNESEGNLSSFAMTSGMYQPKVDFCGTGSAVSSHLPDQSIDRDSVKEETKKKHPGGSTAFIPSDFLLQKV